MVTMDRFSFIVLYVLPYITVPFYGIMMGVRIWVWMRFFNPALVLLPGARGSVYHIWKEQYRPTISLFPIRTRTRLVEGVRFIKGFVFFTGLWKRDKVLWIGSWLLHVGLGLFVLAHVRLLVFWGPEMDRFLTDMAKVGSGLMAVSGMFLLIRRVLVKRVREITGFRDYLAEGILLSFASTAFGLGLTGGVDAALVRTYLGDLLTFSHTPVNWNGLWVWHMVCLQLLLMVMPFSHLLHLGGIFLSRAFLGSSDSFAGEFGEQ